MDRTYPLPLAARAAAVPYNTAFAYRDRSVISGPLNYSNVLAMAYQFLGSKAGLGPKKLRKPVEFIKSRTREQWEETFAAGYDLLMYETVNDKAFIAKRDAIFANTTGGPVQFFGVDLKVLAQKVSERLDDGT